MGANGQSQFTSPRTGQRIGPEKQLTAASAVTPAQHQQRTTLKQLDCLNLPTINVDGGWRLRDQYLTGA